MKKNFPQLSYLFNLLDFLAFGWSDETMKISWSLFGWSSILKLQKRPHAKVKIVEAIINNIYIYINNILNEIIINDRYFYWFSTAKLICWYAVALTTAVDGTLTVTDSAHG